MITTQIAERTVAKNPTIGTSPSTPSTTAEGARRSSLDEFADWTLWADKVVSL